MTIQMIWPDGSDHGTDLMMKIENHWWNLGMPTRKLNIEFALIKLVSLNVKRVFNLYNLIISDKPAFCACIFLYCLKNK